MKKNTKMFHDFLKLLYEHQERIVKLERLVLEFFTKEQQKVDSSDTPKNLKVYLLHETEDARQFLETHDSEHSSPLVLRVRKIGEAS